MSGKLIAIDFDDTLTVDPELWAAFIAIARVKRHRLIVVTCRRDTEENRELVSDWLQENGLDIGVHFTSLGSKLDYMKKRGLEVDIWIDDDPRCVIEGK